MNKKDTDLGNHYLKAVTGELQRLKSLAEGAFAQIGAEKQYHVVLDKESNSVAILIQHLSGNMLSRWTDFLTTDGEKPDRNRDREFEPGRKLSRDQLMEVWNRGWDCLFRTFKSLAPEDLQKQVTIRGEGYSVVEAIQIQISHYAYHVGQIVFLVKHFESDRWKSLSIPRGQSARYHRASESFWRGNEGGG
jgi:hypothetical protein